MSVYDLTKKVNAFFSEVLGQKCRVLTVLHDENQWKAACEVIVDPEYTTRKGLGDIVEIYEVYLDDRLDVTGFALKETKRRASIDDER
jgi:hypothetical protein